MKVGYGLFVMKVVAIDYINTGEKGWLHFIDPTQGTMKIKKTSLLIEELNKFYKIGFMNVLIKGRNVQKWCSA